MGFKHNNGIVCPFGDILVRHTNVPYQFSMQTTSEKIGNAGSALGSINQAPKSAEDEPVKPRLPPLVFAPLPFSDLPFAPKRSAITENLGRDVGLLSLN